MAIEYSPERKQDASNNLVYRYNPRENVDGLHGDEGTLNMCTFWLVEALTRAGRVDKARLEEGEQTGPSGEALGKFPQAFTHLALITAAHNLDRALDGWK